MPEDGKRRSPAFLFYASDFYSACADLEPSDVGVYILLLCQQWDRGGLPADVTTLGRLARGKVKEAVLSKFPLCEDGLRRNARLERERAAHSAYIEGKRRAGRESARVRAAARTTPDPEHQHNGNTVASLLPPCSNTDEGHVGDLLATNGQPPNPNPNPKSIEPTSQALQGALVPSEAEVLAFCRDFPGAPVHGIPPVIPTAWALNWMAWRMAPGRPPLVDWRGELLRKFKAEFAERRPLALASLQASAPSASAPKKGDLPAWRQLEEAKAEWKASPLNPDSSSYMGDELMTPRLREKAAAMAAAAGE